MSVYDFLKIYQLKNEVDTSEDPNARHVFYPLQKSDISDAEQQLGFALPAELTDFYTTIGYGFFHQGNKWMAFNRFLPPDNVADVHLRADYYEHDPDLDMYDNPARLIFFEINEGLYLTLDITSQNQQTSVYYLNNKIAESLAAFIQAFANDEDYFDRFEE